MTARLPTHLIVGEETAVRLRPTEARLVLIGTTGPAGRFDLTFLTVPAVDRVMAALADIRDALNTPTSTRTDARDAPPGGGDRQAAKASGRKSPVRPARPPWTPPPGARAMPRGCRRTGANGPAPGT